MRSNRPISEKPTRRLWDVLLGQVVEKKIKGVRHLYAEHIQFRQSDSKLEQQHRNQVTRLFVSPVPPAPLISTWGPSESRHPMVQPPGCARSVPLSPTMPRCFPNCGRSTSSLFVGTPGRGRGQLREKSRRWELQSTNKQVDWAEARYRHPLSGWT